MSVPVSTAVELYEPVLSEAEQAALLGFLASYRGCTREAYSLDLRQFVAWCAEQHRHLFDARRVDIELFARHLEDTAGHDRRSPGACARSPGSTATPRTKASSTGHLRRTSGGRGSTTSPTSPIWTATKSARSSSPPVCPAPATTPWCRCWR